MAEDLGNLMGMRLRSSSMTRMDLKDVLMMYSAFNLIIEHVVLKAFDLAADSLTRVMREPVSGLHGACEGVQGLPGLQCSYVSQGVWWCPEDLLRRI